MSRFFIRFISWISIVITIVYLILLWNELISSYQLSILDLTFEAYMLGVVLVASSIISYRNLKYKLKYNASLTIIQVLIIIYCAYLVYYWHFSEETIIYCS